MPRQSQEKPENRPYLEVPLVVYSGGRRVRVGAASVFGDGLAAHFDENTDDGFAKTIIKAITEGAVNALSIIPTPEREPTLADYIKERTELCPEQHRSLRPQSRN